MQTRLKALHFSKLYFFRMRCLGRPSRMSCSESRNGGASRNRTDDILLAKQTLYQLSYGPLQDQCKWKWWARADSNCRPHAYQACALTD